MVRPHLLACCCFCCLQTSWRWLFLFSKVKMLVLLEQLVHDCWCPSEQQAAAGGGGATPNRSLPCNSQRTTKHKYKHNQKQIGTQPNTNTNTTKHKYKQQQNQTQTQLQRQLWSRIWLLAGDNKHHYRCQPCQNQPMYNNQYQIHAAVKRDFTSLVWDSCIMHMAFKQRTCSYGDDDNPWWQSNWVSYNFHQISFFCNLM